jgi:hypothetical protein
MTLKQREEGMETEREEERSPAKRSLREWFRLIFPEARMRVATRRMPRDWFELLTRIPIIERMVIKRFVENLMCEQWLNEPHHELQGMNPKAASKEMHGRPLLEALLTQMAREREKTPREIRRIRKLLGI